MNRPGRPSKDDSIGLLAMAKVMISNPDITPTYAFREVYPTLQGEQSLDAARVRYLRKFKKQGPRLMAQLQRPKSEQSRPTGDLLQRLEAYHHTIDTLQRHTLEYFDSNAVMNMARQIEQITANDRFSTMVNEIQKGIANDHFSIAVRELESVIANDRYAAAVLNLQSLTANDALVKAARLSEIAMANNAFQQAIQYASRTQF